MFLQWPKCTVVRDPILLIKWFCVLGFCLAVFYFAANIFSLLISQTTPNFAPEYYINMWDGASPTTVLPPDRIHHKPIRLIKDASLITNPQPSSRDCLTVPFLLFFVPRSLLRQFVYDWASSVYSVVRLLAIVMTFFSTVLILLFWFSFPRTVRLWNAFSSNFQSSYDLPILEKHPTNWFGCRCSLVQCVICLKSLFLVITHCVVQKVDSIRLARHLFRRGFSRSFNPSDCFISYFGLCFCSSHQ